MKIKIKIMLFLAVTIAVTTLFFSGEHISARLFSNANAPSAAPQIPEYVLYESVFRLDLSFRRKALEQELMGKPVTSLKTYFKNEAGLSDAEDVTLQKISLEYLQEIQPVNDQATQILSSLRTQFPDGEINEGQVAPAPPPELAALQQQRNSIALSNRDKLVQAFGTSRFGAFDSFVKQDFAANFQALGSPRQQ